MQQNGATGARVVGAALVVGGGIAGMQAALDLAESGIQVYLLEKSPWIGGRMAQLDKTFPTNDCAMCIMSPRLVECSRHHNIQIISNADVVSLTGEAGDFTATIRKRARYVDEAKCTGCGICIAKCPWKTDSEFNLGLSKRKAIYTPFAQAVPNVPFIDTDLCMYFKRGTCKACVMFCELGAIDLGQQDQYMELEVGAVILAPGSDIYDAGLSEEFGFGRYPNVLTSLQFERLLSAAGPTQGSILRPSDGVEPRKIAWFQCVGSRDQEHPYCSAVCCMYATKEAMLAKEHLPPGAEFTIFLMDLRAFGKGFDAYFQRAQEEGIRYVRCRASALTEVPGSKSLLLQYENERGELLTEEFDMVALSVGMTAPKGVSELAAATGVALNSFGFGDSSPSTPLETSRPGVYLCGTFRGPKDIPDSVTEASGAAGEVQRLLASGRGTLVSPKEFPAEMSQVGEEPRVGVFVCHCGSNIAGVVDVEEVARRARELPGVVYTDHVMFACSTDSLKAMREAIVEHRLNRVVMASCSPRTHEPLFQENVREVGLNPYLYEMANIRDQCSWVHGDRHDEATDKARKLVAMAVARSCHLEPLYKLPQGLSDRALVVGGGVAGMTAALSLAEQGFPVVLVERESQLGGLLLEHDTLSSGRDSREQVSQLVERVQANQNVEVLTDSQVVSSIGFVGNFKTRVASRSDPTQRLVEHGVTIIATGGREYRGDEHLLGQHPGVVTMGDLEKALKSDDPRLRQAKRIVVIQCVGPWDEQPFYCSRVCCTVTMKNILRLKEINPSCQVVVLYKDIRTYGAREEMYTEARRAGAIFVRYTDDDQPVVQAAGEALEVSFTEPSLGERLTLAADLLVSSNALVPSAGAEELSRVFKVPLGREGFFQEAHSKLRPVDFASDGAFLCGVAHYPKSVEEAIIQGKAAAARACRVISQDELMVGGVVASVEEEKCTACLTCVRICPYNVPIIRDGVAIIEAAACQGCGICVGECPAKAIQLLHYRDDQVLAKIEGLVELMAAGSVAR
ncbi:MAG: fumarate reductase/succinate dehydrogenase flavoprotein domain protein [Dehalococcoidia bacterium]|nr:fumarate reductase/succinate dehydrogenase flavoprotein domain protein [Dehalococcoidia bacterium]